jgi:hypothetical protein
MESEIPVTPKDRAEYFKRWLASARDLSRQIELRIGAPIDIDAILATDRQELEQRVDII